MKALGFEDLGFRDVGLGFRLHGVTEQYGVLAGFGVKGLGFKGLKGFGFRIWGLRI